MLNGFSYCNLTVCKKMSSGSFKNNDTYKLYIYIYVCVCEQDLAWNIPQVLICHKIQPPN